jgi:hypothetical protein
VCYKLTPALHSHVGWQTPLRALAVLAIMSLVGFAVTAGLAKLFRVRELDPYLTKLRLRAGAA